LQKACSHNHNTLFDKSAGKEWSFPQNKYTHKCLIAMFQEINLYCPLMVCYHYQMLYNNAFNWLWELIHVSSFEPVKIILAWFVLKQGLQTTILNFIFSSPRKWLLNHTGSSYHQIAVHCSKLPWKRNWIRNANELIR
jgi:hypothetical protein